MHKQGNARGRAWYADLRLLLIFPVLLLAAAWFVERPAERIALRYGEFKQLLDAPGVAFRNVKVGKAEIRGSLTTRDHVSGLSVVSGQSSVAKTGAGEGQLTTDNEQLTTNVDWVTT